MLISQYFSLISSSNMNFKTELGKQHVIGQSTSGQRQERGAPLAIKQSLAGHTVLLYIMFPNKMIPEFGKQFRILANWIACLLSPYFCSVQ